MKNLLNFITSSIVLLVPTSLSAQQVEMADKMRAEGKIYVVVVIILIILVGFLLFLYMQDRKITKIEKYFEDRKQTK